jgi:hypothetical protein
MALAGEWTVTNTRIINDTSTTRDDDIPIEARATGIRKRDREPTEEQKEEDDAVKGLFKKSKRWGRDIKDLPAEEDKELDELLSGDLVRTTKKEADPVDALEEAKEDNDSPTIKRELLSVSAEEHQGGNGNSDEKTSLKLEATGDDVEDVKGKVPLVDAEDEDTSEVAATAVVFKKRKPKNIRQK